MALSYINNKEIKFGSAKPLNGVYTPDSPTREYEPLDSLGIYLNSGIPLSYGVENGRYMSMSDEFVATSQGNSYSFNQLFAAQMMLGFKLHDRFIACDTEHKIIGTEPLLHKAYLAEITEKTLDYFKIKIYEEKTRTFCIRMSSSEVPTSYVDLTNSFDENGLNLTQTDRQSFLSYYRFYPLTARDPSSRVEETLGIDYYLLPSAEGLKELSGDILSKFNAFISSDGTLTSLGNTAFAYAGDIGYVPNYRGETSEAAVSAAKKAEVILGQVEEMHADINQILPEMKENLELTKQYRDEAMSTEIGTVRTDLDAEINARIEADTALSTKIEVASSVNRYEIENLKAKSEGKLYRTETVEAEAYNLGVPSSVAPYAEVKKIGGKSVVWNQLVRNGNFQSTNGWLRSYGAITVSNNVATITSTSDSHPIQIYQLLARPVGHKVYMSAEYKFEKDISTGKAFVGYSSYGITTNYTANVWKKHSGIYTVNANKTVEANICINGGTLTTNEKMYAKNFIVIDLTQMFGSGNEPTLEECNKIFSADYYPYDDGTIKSFHVKRVKSLKADGTEIGSIDIPSLTTDLKSAGSAHDEWSNGKMTKKIGVIEDMGIFDWVKKTIGGYTRYDSIQSISDIYSKVYITSSSNLLTTSGYTPSPVPIQGNHIDNAIGTYEKKLYIRDDSIESVEELKVKLTGKMMNYFLASSIEEEVPEIDNYLEVEGGGTLTFESDDAVHMPVPSTDRFVVDLTSTEEETT